jgi:hypothetical protein
MGMAQSSETKAAEAVAATVVKENTGPLSGKKSIAASRLQPYSQITPILRSSHWGR